MSRTDADFANEPLQPRCIIRFVAAAMDVSLPNGGTNRRAVVFSTQHRLDRRCVVNRRIRSCHGLCGEFDLRRPLQSGGDILLDGGRPRSGRQGYIIAQVIGGAAAMWVREWSDC